MHDRPTAPELLAIMAETLSETVVPATAPHARHQARVAANLCRILARELTAPAPDADRLAELSRSIETGDDATAAALHAEVSALVKNKLAVVKPGYDQHDAAAEAGIVA